jgi:chromosome segregation ATPase
MSLLDRLTNPSAQESIDKIAALENVIATHETELGTYQAELLEARNAITELATVKQDLTTAQNSLATSLDAVKFANSEIETLKGKLTELETSVPAQAVALAATAGITKPLDIENGSQPIDHLEHMKNLSPAERTAYFNKHKKEIKAQRNK